MPLDEQKAAGLTEETGANPPQQQRAILRRLGRFAAMTPPAVTLLLSAISKPAASNTSLTPVSSRQFKEPVSIPQRRKTA